MNFQNAIVFFIVAAACFYVGRIVWKKVKSFSSAKSSACASGCGCGDARTAKDSFVKVRK